MLFWNLSTSIEEENKEPIVNSTNIWKMKEKIASIAFTSDSGWYMLCGDEFGLKSYSPMVFDNFPKEDSHFKNYNCLEKWGTPTYSDLSQFVANINYVLSKLPAAQLGDWVVLSQKFIISVKSTFKKRLIFLIPINKAYEKAFATEPDLPLNDLLSIHVQAPVLQHHGSSVNKQYTNVLTLESFLS